MFSSKLVAEKKKKYGNALFIKLPRLMDTIQTQFRHPYIVVCHFVKSGILYVLPTYSCDFLSLPHFCLHFDDNKPFLSNLFFLQYSSLTKQFHIFTTRSILFFKLVHMHKARHLHCSS